LTTVGCSDETIRLQSEISERATKIDHHEILDKDIGAYNPIPIRQEIILDESSYFFSADRIMLGSGFDRCGKILLIAQNRYGRFLVTINQTGDLSYLCDLHEIGYGLILDVECTHSGTKYDFCIKYSHGDNEDIAIFEIEENINLLD
jgi:hypothetical protein